MGLWVFLNHCIGTFMSTDPVFNSIFWFLFCNHKKTALWLFWVQHDIYCFSFVSRHLRWITFIKYEIILPFWHFSDSRGSQPGGRDPRGIVREFLDVARWLWGGCRITYFREGNGAAVILWESLNRVKSWAKGQMARVSYGFSIMGPDWQTYVGQLYGGHERHKWAKKAF